MPIKKKKGRIKRKCERGETENIKCKLLEKKRLIQKRGGDVNVYRVKKTGDERGGAEKQLRGGSVRVEK